jgi:hypothetical protein
VPSLTRSRVCTFQFLPGIASAAFLRSEYHGTHEHCLLSLFLRLRQPGGPGSCIYFCQEQGSPVVPSIYIARTLACIQFPVHHIFTKRKHLGVTLTLTVFTKQQAASIQNHPQADLDWYPTLGHGFHIQHRDPGALPIEGPAHDSGHTVVCAEHPYTARPTDPFSQGRYKSLQLSLQRSPHCTPSSPSLRRQNTGACDITCQWSAN